MGNRKGNKTRLYLSAKRKRNHFCRKRQIPVARNSIVGTKMSIPEETAMGDAQSVFIKIEMDVEDTLSKHLEMLEQEKQRNDEDLTQLHTEENIDLEIKQEFQITDVQPTYKEVTVHDKNNLLVEKSSTKQKVVQEMVVLPENVMTEIKTENIPEGNGEFSQNPQEMVHQAMVAFGFPPYDTIVAEGAALANVEACLEDIKSEDTEYEYTMTTLGDLADRRPNRQTQAFDNIIKTIEENFPHNWRAWQVQDIPSEDIFADLVLDPTLYKYRFAIHIVKAFEPNAKVLSQDMYRKIQSSLLKWPIGRALLYSPVFIMETIHVKPQKMLDVVNKIDEKLTDRIETSELLNINVKTRNRRGMWKSLRGMKINFDEAMNSEASKSETRIIINRRKVS